MNLNKKKVLQQKKRLFQASMFNSRKGCIRLQNGVEIFMEQRLKTLLDLMLSNKNDLVTKEEMMTFVWKDLIVTEESITKAVSDLRRFFRKYEFENVSITTIRKIGYQLNIDQESKVKSLGLRIGISVLRAAGYFIIIYFIVIILIRAYRY